MQPNKFNFKTYLIALTIFTVVLFTGCLIIYLFKMYSTLFAVILGLLAISIASFAIRWLLNLK